MGGAPEPLEKYISGKELVDEELVIKIPSGGKLSTTGRVGVSFMNGIDDSVVSGYITMLLYAINPNDNSISPISISGELIRDGSIFNGENIYAESARDIFESNSIQIVSMEFVANYNNGTQLLYDLLIAQMAIGFITSNGSTGMIDMINYNDYSSQLRNNPITYLASFEQLYNFIHSIRVNTYNT